MGKRKNRSVSTHRGPEREKGGRGVYYVISANTREEVQDLVDSIVQESLDKGLEQVDVMSIQSSPSGGWEAVVRAHNFNPLKVVAQKAGAAIHKGKTAKEALDRKAREGVRSIRGKVGSTVKDVKDAYREGQRPKLKEGESYPTDLVPVGKPYFTGSGPDTESTIEGEYRSEPGQRQGIVSKGKEIFGNYRAKRAKTRRAQMAAGYEFFGRDNIQGWEKLSQEGKWKELEKLGMGGEDEGVALFEAHMAKKKIRNKAIKKGLPLETEPMYKVHTVPGHYTEKKDPVTGQILKEWVDPKTEVVKIPGRKMHPVELEALELAREKNKAELRMVKDYRRRQALEPGLSVFNRAVEVGQVMTAVHPNARGGGRPGTRVTPTSMPGGVSLYRVPIIPPVGMPRADSGSLSHFRSMTVPRIRRMR